MLSATSRSFVGRSRAFPHRPASIVVRLRKEHEMAEILLFHHALGRTSGIDAFANEIRQRQT